MEQPPGSPKPPDFGDMAGKIKSARGPDRVILIAGLLFFVDSFLPWYGIKLGPFSANVSGWRSGGLAVISILLAIAATLFAAMKTGGMQVGGAASEGMIYLALGGGAFVFALLRLLTETNFTRYGLYLGIILGAVLAYGGWQKYKGSRA